MNRSPIFKLWILTTLLATPAYAEPTVVMGDWAYTEAQDRFTDKTVETVFTVSKLSGESTNGSFLNAIIFSVTCNGDSLNISFKPNKFLAGNPNGFTDLEYRVDKNPSVTVKTSIVYTQSIGSSASLVVTSKDKASHNTIEGKMKLAGAEWLRQISNGSTIIIRVGDAQEEFSLDGAATQIKKVTDHCPFIFEK